MVNFLAPHTVANQVLVFLPLHCWSSGGESRCTKLRYWSFEASIYPYNCLTTGIPRM